MQMLRPYFAGDFALVHRVLLDRVEDVEAEVDEVGDVLLDIAARVQPEVHAERVRLVDELAVVGLVELVEYGRAEERPLLRSEVVGREDAVDAALVLCALHGGEVEIGHRAEEPVDARRRRCSSPSGRWSSRAAASGARTGSTTTWRGDSGRRRRGWRGRGRRSCGFGKRLRTRSRSDQSRMAARSSRPVTGASLGSSSRPSGSRGRRPARRRRRGSAPGRTARPRGSGRVSR